MLPLSLDLYVAPMLIGTLKYISTIFNYYQIGSDVCGRPFSLNGVYGLTLEGCGGQQLYIDHNRVFWANCAYWTNPNYCKTTATNHCS